MKTIEKLVKEYIADVEIMNRLESKEIQFNTLEGFLYWQEKYNENIIQLKKAIITKYNVDFNGGCNCKGQEKLNELCKIYLVKSKKIVQYN